MSKKNRNKLRKQKNRTKSSDEPKKSIDASTSIHHQKQQQNNQIVIIETKKINDDKYTSRKKSENFCLKPSWMMKKSSSFNCNHQKKSLDQNVYFILHDDENNLTFNLKIKFICLNQTFIPSPNYSLAKVYYRFDLIIDFLYFIQQYFIFKYSMPSTPIKRQRPGYIIERDCHIFGGCVEDEAQDEFFISSGAVYQSWPYVYEPGYKMTPLIEHVNWPLSRSADSIYINDYNDDFENDSVCVQDDLPAYSLENFDAINLMHVDKTKHKKKKWNSNGSDSYDCSTDECFYEDSDSDDSESIIAYKQRHAIGLNCFNLELKSIHQRHSNKFSSVVYYDESPKDNKIQFLSQKRFDKSVNDLYCCNQDFVSSRRDKFFQANKYSYSSDNLVF